MPAAKPPDDGSTWATVAPSSAHDIGLPAVPGYQILGELGRGGMGVVYKARHVKLNRIVALKMILRAEYAGEQERARFRTEAESVARLRHPGIIQIHEVGEHQGRPFFALEFVSGGGLDQFLNRQPLPAREAAALTEQLARAVQHAHEHGVVHRDLKPANVLVEGHDAAPGGGDTETLDAPRAVTLKIADFGLAKQLDNSDGPTGSQALLGTPSYMAPEQARGKARDVGPAADVYAVGATLYEMLTGRPPFRGATPADTVLQVLNDEPVPPRQLNGRVPRDLETIALKCLAKDARQRYASAADLADDLGRFRDGLPVLARPAAAPERLMKWVRRRPAAAALLALVAAALVGSLAAGMAFVSRARQQRLHAERLEGEAREAREEIEAQAERMKGHADAERAARALADKHRDEADHNRQSAQLDLADLALDRGIARCEVDDVGQGLLWFARAVELAQTTSPRLRPLAEAIDRVARLELAAWIEQLPVRVVRLLPHDKGVECAVFRPDGRRILTGSADGKARVWDAEGGQLGRALAHDGPVRCAAWSPDGKTIATGTGDGWNHYSSTARRKGEVRLWDAATGKLRHKLAHGGTVWAVAFSPDGKHLLSGCGDRYARLWEVSGAKLLDQLEHPHAVSCVAFHGNGKVFTTATCVDNWNTTTKTAQVQRWDATTRQKRGEPTPVNNVRALSVGGNGRARVGSLDGSLRFLGPDGQPARESVNTGSNVAALAIGPKNSTLVAGGSDFKVRVRQMSDGKLIGPPLYLAAAVSCVAFGADDDTFLTGDEVSARLWRVQRQANPGVTLDLGGKKPDKLALTPNGGEALVHCEEKWRMFDTATGKPTSPAYTLPAPVRFADLSHDGDVVLLGLGNTRFRSFKTRTGEARYMPINLDSLSESLAVSPDGKLAAAGQEKGNRFGVYDLATGKRLWETVCRGLPSTAAFAPDGKTVAVGTWRSVVQHFEATTGKPAGKDVPMHGAVLALSLGADSRTVLASAHGPHFCFQGDTTTGKTNGVPLRRHAEGTAISPDGRTLLTRYPHQMRLWDAATNKPIGPLLPHQGMDAGVGSYGHKARLAVFADARTALTIGKDGRVRRWPIRPGVEGSAERIGLWVQVRSGLTLDAHGAVGHLSEQQWRQAFEKLRRLPGPALP